MTVFKLTPPRPAEVSWWRVMYTVSGTEDPIATWYEVAADGKALRSVDVMAHGALRADDVARYPTGATPAGFGSLINRPFFDLDWSWPDAGEDDPITPVAVSRREFALIWAAATV